MSRASTIKDLNSAIRRVEERKNQIDKELESLRGALTYFESMPDESEMETAAEALRNAIYEILKAEHPLHRSMIYDRLKERGINIPGKEPVNNVGSHLSLDARFTNVGKGMWTINESYIEHPTGPRMPSEEESSNHINVVTEVAKELDEGYSGINVDELLRNNGVGTR